MVQVFISHSGRDDNFARELAIFLGRERVESCLASSAHCYANLADLARERGDHAEALKRAEAALASFIELKMPRETETTKKLLQMISTQGPPSS